MPLGRHVILECHECDKEQLKDQDFLQRILEEGAEFARAQVLHSYFHKFDQGEGVTGVVALAESHISIHTWPEHHYTAIDIFMCGDCNPYDTVDYILNHMIIGEYSIDCIDRGVNYQNLHNV